MDAKDAALPAEPAIYDALRQKAAAELEQAGDHGGDAASRWRIDEVLVGGLGIAALLVCSYNVLVRYFHSAWTLEWADEVQVYVMVWAVFLALGAVTVADRHVKADLFVSLFPPRVRAAVEVSIDLLGLAFALVLLWYGSILAWQSWSFGDVSTTSLRFPLWIYVSCLPVGALGLAVGYVVRLARRAMAEEAS